MSKRLSFRGRLQDGDQDTITLHTISGKVGYQIKKFQVISETPVTSGVSEHVVLIWKVEQSSVPAAGDVKIDFDDNRLLAAGTWCGSDNPIYQSTEQVIFDNEVFNQDIYITHRNADGGDPKDAVNYYIELETMDLALDEQTVATLKDIRNTGTQ